MAKPHTAQGDAVQGPFAGPEADAVYRLLTNAVPDPLIVVDEQQTIVLFNRAAERVFGYRDSDVLGQSLNVLLPEQYRENHPDMVNGFAARGAHHHRPAAVRSAVEARRSDGTVFPAEVSLSTLEVGGRRFFTAALRDISARVEMEEALAVSEKRFRAAFEESPVSMVLVSVDGEFIAGNRAFTEQTGYTAGELRGRWLGAIIHEEDVPLLEKELIPVIAGESPAVQAQVRYVRPNGELRTIDLFLAPIDADSGEASYMIGEAIDITHRIEAQARLEELVRSKDELIASISHELRTPLTSLVGFSQLLLDHGSVLTAEEKAEMLDSIVSESTDLTNIVEDLLAAARAESGRLSVENVAIDLEAQAAQILEMWIRSDRVSIEVTGGPAVAYGDRGRVRQILRNLVSNAVRYGVEPITIEFAQGNGTVVAKVKDRGEPIPKEDRARIFEPYERAHHVDGLTASMGLGLAISRQLARLMGGNLAYLREEDANIFELTLRSKEGSG